RPEGEGGHPPAPRPRGQAALDVAARVGRQGRGAHGHRVERQRPHGRGRGGRAAARGATAQPGGRQRGRPPRAALGAARRPPPPPLRVRARGGGRRVTLRLGHVALTVNDVERSRDFYAGLLCLHEHHREPGAVYLRANEEFDVWSLCLKQGPTAGLGHAAFRVSTPDALADLERLHRDRGLPTRRVPAGHEPGQGEALRARTSDGHPVEFYFAMEQVSPYDEDGRVRLPMRRTNRAGPVSPARIDHVNLRSTDMEASLAYWRDALGFSVSE